MSVGRSRFTGNATRWRGHLGAFVLVVCIAPGCAPGPDDVDDGVIETAHLRITTSEDNPICAGTPVLLESELQRIADALELPLWAEDDKLEIRYGLDAVDEVCKDVELEGIGGCVDTRDSEVVVAATEIAYTTSHELVHAVRRRSLRLGHPVFEEGLAEVLSGSDGFPVYIRYPHGEPHARLMDLLASPQVETVHYGVGKSFMSWLWETYDRPTLMAFMNDPALPDNETVHLLFEQHFGLPLVDAEQAWLVDERPDPTWGAPCIPERTYSLSGGPLELSGNFDCSEPTVYGASYSMALWPMCLDVPQNTRVRLSLEAEHGQLQVLGREPCDPGSTSAEARRSKYLEAGDVLEEDIAGCRYRMLLFSQEPGFPATPYTIRIEEIRI